MSNRSRTCLVMAAGSIAGAALVLLNHPGGIVAAYRDTAGLPEAWKMSEQEDVRRKAYCQQAAVIADRIALKEVLVRDLVAGRASLVEVTRRFYEMNVDNPIYMHAIRSRYPQASVDECMARNVLDFVELQPLAGEDVEEVRQRLDEEFRRVYGARSRPAF